MTREVKMKSRHQVQQCAGLFCLLTAHMLVIKWWRWNIKSNTITDLTPGSADGGCTSSKFGERTSETAELFLRDARTYLSAHKQQERKMKAVIRHTVDSQKTKHSWGMIKNSSEKAFFPPIFATSEKLREAEVYFEVFTPLSSRVS